MKLLGEVGLFGNGLVRGNLGSRGFLNRGLLCGSFGGNFLCGCAAAAVSSTAFGSSLQQGHLGREAKIFFAHATI